MLCTYLCASVLYRGLCAISVSSALGTLDAIIITAMLVLRSQMAAIGGNITINAVFTTVERSSAVIGPALAGLFLWELSNTDHSFFGAYKSDQRHLAMARNPPHNDRMNRHILTSVNS